MDNIPEIPPLGNGGINVITFSDDEYEFILGAIKTCLVQLVGMRYATNDPGMTEAISLAIERYNRVISKLERKSTL